MIIYTLTRIEGEKVLVLRYTPVLEDYLVQSSEDGGLTFSHAVRRTKRQANEVLSYYRSRGDTLIEETPKEQK